MPRSQIGPRALACIGTLGTRYHLTQGKVRDLLAQMLGVDFSIGAISQAHGKVAAALAAPVRQARASLRTAPVVHMDETHYPREGTTSGHWVWSVVQPELAVFSIWSSRARYVAQDLIGLAPRGVVVSDRYAAYAFLDANQRQVCWAHLLRDFRRMGERAGQAGRIGRRLLGAGYVLFRWRTAGKTTQAQFEPLQRRIRRALEEGAAQKSCSRTANTCANLLKLWPALWGVHHAPGCGADQQCGRAGPARHRAQAQDLGADAFSPRRRVHRLRLHCLRNLPAPGTRPHRLPARRRRRVDRQHATTQPDASAHGLTSRQAFSRSTSELQTYLTSSPGGVNTYRSTTQRLGITANLCSSLRLAICTVAPSMSRTDFAKGSPT